MQNAQEKREDIIKAASLSSGAPTSPGQYTVLVFQHPIHLIPVLLTHTS